MNISNDNYNKIIRSYEETRTRNSNILDNHYKEVTNTIPRIKEVDNAISELCIAQAKKNITKNNDNFKSESEMFNALINKLEDEKRTLLINNGYSSDYLDLKYDCNICHDTGYVNGSKCECFQKKVVELILNKENNPFLTDEVRFEDFNLDYYPDNYTYKKTGKTPKEIASIALDKVLDFSLNFSDHSRNLIIEGNTGVGKTYLASAISTTITKRGGLVMYLSSTELFEQLYIYRYSYNEKYTPSQVEQAAIIKSQLDECDLLIVDDLGTEPNVNFSTSELYNILEKREHAKVSTVITTNLSRKDIKKIYSERIFSRIYKNYDRIILIGDDIRVKKKKIELLEIKGE